MGADEDRFSIIPRVAILTVSGIAVATLTQLAPLCLASITLAGLATTMMAG